MKIFLDVGAHEGQTLEVVIGRFDMIYAFEPMPMQYSILRDRFAGKEGITIYHCGLAGRTGFRTLYGANDGMEATLYPDKLDVDENVVERCFFYRASTFFHKNIALNDTVVMKLNCEGAEVEIMNDLLDSGEAEKIDHVMIDFDVRKIPSQSATEVELLRRMKSLDFDRYSLCEKVMVGETHRDRTNAWINGWA